MIASLMIVSLAACGTKKEHVHRYDTGNIEWFWKQLQNKDYEARATFTCLDCKEGQEGHSVVKIAEVTKAITTAATCLAKGEYTYTATVTFQGQQYSNLKKREFVDENAHHYVEIKDAQYLLSEATCENDAVYYKSCEHCHEKSAETFTDAGSKLGHNLEHHDATTSTCSVHGNVEYYQCTRCHKYFLTPNGEAVGWNQIELPLSHNMTYHPGTQANCTTDGSLGYYTCAYEPGVKYYDEEGEHVVEHDEDLFVKALGHSFGENHHCIRCDITLEDEYGLVNPTLEDEIAPTLLSDLNIPDGTNFPTSDSHTFRDYDFAANKGIDLWFKYNYQIKTGDSQIAVYLFNNHDESGVRFRIETNRTEDDGIAFGYFIYNGVATHVIFPKTANIKTGQEITVHIFAYLINETNNTFRVGYQAGVDQMYNPVLASGGTGYEVDSPLFTRDVELGASYFETGTYKHNVLRFSAVNNNTVTIKNGKSFNRKIILKNESGDILGVKTFDTDTLFEMPSLYKENKKFLGWFDKYGNKNSSFTVDTTYDLTARFIDEQSSMFVPSDASFATGNQWLSITKDSALEDYRPLPVSSSSTRNDIYFVLDAAAREGADPFVVFGFPFTDSDIKTRVFIRIDFNQDLHYLRGYLFGTTENSLGAPGSSNLFNDHDFAIDNYKLLVHLYAKSTVAGDLSFTVGAEIINLGNGQSFSIEKEVSSSVNFSTADAARNMFCLLQVENAIGSEFKITDAF